MFSRHAISVFLLLLAAIYSSEETVTPMVVRTDPPVQDMDCPSHLVLGPNKSYDYDINATFECTAPDTTTLWRVGDYLLVDRDEFMKQGLIVLDPRQGESKLVFKDSNEERKGGFPFVFEALERCYFTLCCLVVEDSVNVHTCNETYSSLTVATYDCKPQKPKITIERCNGTVCEVNVTRPPYYNDLVELNYNITINCATSYKLAPSVSTYNSSFIYRVGGCGEGCEICVKAISCEGESEEACDTVKKGQCNPCVAKEPTIRCLVNCTQTTTTCSIEYKLEYQILCDKSYRYAFCDDIDGCSDLRNEDSKSVNVTVPVTSMMDFSYTVTFMVCTYDICLNTTTPLGTVTCSDPELVISEVSDDGGDDGGDDDGDDGGDEDALTIAIATVASSVGGVSLGAILGAMVACCIMKCRQRNKTHDSMELMKTHQEAPN